MVKYAEEIFKLKECYYCKAVDAVSPKLSISLNKITQKDFTPRTAEPLRLVWTPKRTPDVAWHNLWRSCQDDIGFDTTIIREHTRWYWFEDLLGKLPHRIDPKTEFEERFSRLGPKAYTYAEHTDDELQILDYLSHPDLVEIQHDKKNRVLKFIIALDDEYPKGDIAYIQLSYSGNCGVTDEHNFINYPLELDEKHREFFAVEKDYHIFRERQSNPHRNYRNILWLDLYTSSFHNYPQYW